jgi:hypothetical protein
MPSPPNPSPGMLPGEGEHHPTPGMGPSPMHEYPELCMHNSGTQERGSGSPHVQVHAG